VATLTNGPSALGPMLEISEHHIKKVINERHGRFMFRPNVQKRLEAGCGGPRGRGLAVFISVSPRIKTVGDALALFVAHAAIASLFLFGL
jgi:hypothetical protein